MNVISREIYTDDRILIKGRVNKVQSSKINPQQNKSIQYFNENVSHTNLNLR